MSAIINAVGLGSAAIPVLITGAAIQVAQILYFALYGTKYVNERAYCRADATYARDTKQLPLREAEEAPP